jgi:hypothetical protein
LQFGGTASRSFASNAKFTSQQTCELIRKLRQMFGQWLVEADFLKKKAALRVKVSKLQGQKNSSIFNFMLIFFYDK